MGLSYRDLIAWQKAMDLVEEIYKISRGFPKDELYVSCLNRLLTSSPERLMGGF
jgi:hypothetical protein